MNKQFRVRFREDPKKTIEDFYNENIEEISIICDEELKIYKMFNKNDLNKQLIEKCIEETLKSESKDIMKDVIAKIKSKAEKLIRYYYNQTNKAIPFSIYRKYFILAYSKTEEERQEYEDKSFTYESIKLTSLEDRIYDSMSDIINDYDERLSQGDCTVEEYSYIRSTFEEIAYILNRDKDMQRALYLLVALQIEIGYGTKFLNVLTYYLSGRLPFNIEISKNNLDNQKGRSK